jgi:hypothetical protein
MNEDEKNIDLKDLGEFGLIERLNYLMKILFLVQGMMLQ